MHRIAFVFGIAFAMAGPVAAAPTGDAAALPVTRAPEGAEVYIISPSNGATVGREVTVRFGLKGMGVAPAGVPKERTGHHHLLVDVSQMPAAGQPIPADARHIHFGGGQTQTTVTLNPGTHTLQLELADQHHMPFEPALVSPKITIHVQ